MSIQVSKLRLSLVRVQDHGDQPPLMQFGRYEQAFTGAFAKDAAWQLPWPGGSTAAPELARPDVNRQFWLKHLEVDAPRHIGWRCAWKHLMPLRRRLPPARVEPVPDAASPLADLKLDVEGYCFPAAMAVVVNLRSDSARALADMVDAAIAARGALYHVRWRDDDATVDKLSLDQLMQRALGRLRGEIAQAEPDLRSLNEKLIVVAAFLDGRGVNPTAPVVANDEIHRALAALCRFDSAWKQSPNAMRPLDHTTQLALDRRKLHDGDLVFASELRRAIWFPTYFRDNFPRGNLHYIGWYQRNLTLAALMTEAVMVQLRRIDDLLRRDQLDGDNERPLGQHAARLVARLYAGNRNTYQTDSIRHHIDPDRTLVNRVRTTGLIKASRPVLQPRLVPPPPVPPPPVPPPPVPPPPVLPKP
jgi:hypothetical protein